MMVALGVLLSINASAIDAEVNGIYYALRKSNKTASVTYVSTEGKAYAGDIIIPKEIIANDVTYLVTTIGVNAFKGCTGLTSVTIPESVTSIDAAAFEGCSGLTSVTIPESVTSINAAAFEGCSGLTSVTIPSSVTSIGGSAFSGCSGLTSITIPNSVTTIGRYAFYKCSGLTSVTIPSSVTTIDEGAFSRCSGLTSVIIPNSVTSIGGYAFSWCSGLTSVTIPSSVTSIGGSAFYDCSGLTSITIPESVTSIGGSAFAYCSGLTSVYITDLTAWCNISFSNSPANPLCYAPHLFLNGEDVKNLVIPNSVTNISDYAFYGCSGLTSVTIPNSVTSIGSSVFKGCSGLTSITIQAETPPSVDAGGLGVSQKVLLYVQKGLQSIYESANGWEKLTVVEPYYVLTYMVDDEVYKTMEMGYGKSITSIDKPAKEGYTFSGWKGIPATMPNRDVTVTAIFSINSYNIIYMVDGEEYQRVENAYGTKLVPINEPKKDGYTFSGWSEIPRTMPAYDVVVYGSFTKLPPEKFVGEDEIDGLWYQIDGPKKTAVVIKSRGKEYSGDITIPASVNLEGFLCEVTAIGDNAFSNCGKVTSVKIANGVKRIGGAAFEDCGNLLSIDIPNSVTVIEAAAFTGCKSLAALLIPEGVTELGVYFAEYCESLTSLGIPNSVTKIDDFAFRDCKNLKTLTIPSSVESIGRKAFSGCGELTDVYCYAEKVPTTKSDAFEDCYIDYETLHVPEEALGKYKAREPWKQFGYIVPIEEVHQTYTLTYMLDGILYKKYELEKGAKIKTEDEPVKEGYTFSGWSEVPTTMPANDVTVTGSFTINSYTLTYMVDDEVYKTYTVEYGATVEEEAAPEKDGYIFSGWSETLGTMPAHDVTITGSFTFVDGIAGVSMDGKADGIYTLDGRKIEKLQKGVNIIRTSDGNVKKIYVK